MRATPGGSEDWQARPLFLRSLTPMLVVNDEREYVDANAAACLFVRLPRAEVCKLRIDDLTRPELRLGMDALWTEFVRGSYSAPGTYLRWDLQMPDGTIVPVDISSTPNFRPGRHLARLLFPATYPLNEAMTRATPMADTAVLSGREREVLTLVAVGHTGIEIAAKLVLSPATAQTHMANTLRKLGARNRAHAIAIALQTGELDLQGGLHQPRVFHSDSNCRGKPGRWTGSSGGAGL